MLPFSEGDTTMPLTDAQVRNARYHPDGTGNRLSDGGRMYLQLDKSGAKYWRSNCPQPAFRPGSRLTGLKAGVSNRG
jgi:hypothetical protein